MSASVELDRVFHALADPSRLGMVERLCRGPVSVKELAEPLDMALPSVMKHLGVLEDAGLVRSKKLGRVRTYQLQPAALTSIEKWVARRRDSWNRQFDRRNRCCSRKTSAPTRGDHDEPTLREDVHRATGDARWRR